MASQRTQGRNLFHPGFLVREPIGEAHLLFICEDDKSQLERLKNTINNYIFFKNYDIEFEMATIDPKDILNYIKENKTFGLYFLDVDLNNKLNGIALASEIRNYDLCGKIVFVTTHSELSYLTFIYKVEAMDYIIKDNSFKFEDKIKDCIDIAYERYINESNPYKNSFIIKTCGRDIKIVVDDIQFIESASSPHKLLIHLENRQIEFYGKIKEMDKTNKNLYRCHQSYVVNIKNISQINKQSREIIMVNGEICYASIRYLKTCCKMKLH